MNILEHAKKELTLAGYDINYSKKGTMDGTDYANRIGKSVLDLLEVFVKQGHTPVSANYVIRIFNQLVSLKALTELTDNPDEWFDVSDKVGKQLWRSNRQPSCFTEDMKVYYDIDDPDNNIFELDEQGRPTGYGTLKQFNERKFVELKHV